MILCLDQAIYENFGVRGKIPINRLLAKISKHFAVGRVLSGTSCVADRKVCGPESHTSSWNHGRIQPRCQKARVQSPSEPCFGPLWTGGGGLA